MAYLAWSSPGSERDRVAPPSVDETVAMIEGVAAAASASQSRRLDPRDAARVRSLDLALLDARD